MPAINCPGKDILEDLSIIATQIDGKVDYGHGSALVTVGNSIAEGTIKAYRISSQISALFAEVVLHQQLDITFRSGKHQQIALLYCLEGSCLHKFSGTASRTKLNFRQNVVAKVPARSGIDLKFETGRLIKFSYIRVEPLEAMENGNHEFLNDKTIGNYLKENISKPYLHAGRICVRTARAVEGLTRKYSSESSGNLFREGAILNTVASQFERYESDTSGKYSGAPLKLYELDKIMATSGFIRDNLSENYNINHLQRLTGLNPTKLQAGFRFLFGKSVNAFITDCRLEKAAELLQESELTVSEVVYSIGFTSRSYFTKIYKRKFGLLPSDIQGAPAAGGKRSFTNQIL